MQRITSGVDCLRRRLHRNRYDVEKLLRDLQFGGQERDGVRVRHFKARVHDMDQHV